MEKMRIGLITIFEIENGAGVAQHIIRTAKELTELGHDVEIISGDGFLPLKRMQTARLTIEKRTQKRLRIPLIRIAIIKYRMWRLRKCVKRVGKLDILNTMDIFATNAVLPLSRKWKAPVVSSFLGYTIFHALSDWRATKNDKYYRFLVELEKKAFSESRIVICMDQSRMDYLRNMGLNNGILLPGGTDTEIFKPANQKDNCLLFVGNLLPEKGIRESILAFAEIAPEFPGLKFVIIGDGPLKAELFELAKKLGIDERVEFLGYIPNEMLPSYYARARAYLLPTIPVAGIKDGPAYTVQEAMACGLPVIVSNVGGLSELVQNGENGLVVLSGDIEGLAEAIRKLLKDKEFAARIAKKARDTIVSRYSQKKLVMELVEIYRGLKREVGK